MKKVIALGIVILILSLSSMALASEKYTLYEQALSANTWNIVGYQFMKDEDNLELLLEYSGGSEIKLPDENIKLFEDSSGQIYLVYCHGYEGRYRVISIGEIIFDKDMSSFILYSNGHALLYEIKTEE